MNQLFLRDVALAAIAEFEGLAQACAMAALDNETVTQYFEATYVYINARTAQCTEIIDFATAHILSAKALINLMHKHKCYDVVECLIAEGVLREVGSFYVIKKTTAATVV